MKKTNPIAIFIGAICFVACILPILDSLSNLIQQLIANKIVKLQYVQAQDQEEIQDISDRLTNTGPVNAIGFHHTMEEDNYDED